jgi:hypothetical protein
MWMLRTSCAITLESEGDMVMALYETESEGDMVMALYETYVAM